jgi:hypothetical protein
MELFVTISSLLRRYDFVLEHPDQPVRIKFDQPAFIAFLKIVLFIIIDI